MHGALMHGGGDHVAVVIRNIAKGDPLKAVTIEGDTVTTINAVETIPLGHKIATQSIAKGTDVIKYGRSIGIASADIAAGAHVHTHNIKSKRWA